MQRREMPRFLSFRGNMLDLVKSDNSSLRTAASEHKPGFASKNVRSNKRSTVNIPGTPCCWQVSSKRIGPESYFHFLTPALWSSAPDFFSSPCLALHGMCFLAFFSWGFELLGVGHAFIGAGIESYPYLRTPNMPHRPIGHIPTDIIFRIKKIPWKRDHAPRVEKSSGERCMLP